MSINEYSQLSVLVCGDFYSDSNSPGEDYFSDSVIEFFLNSDLNIINLECPVVEDKNKKILKSGPHLAGSPFTFSYLEQIKTNLVTLATNHLMDFGVEGLRNTLNLCDKHSIAYVGAGLTIEEAREPFFMEKDNTRLAVLNFAENEWSIATRDKGGANPLNIIDNVKQIREAGKTNDFVIVIIHGGHEQYHFPSPRMIKQYRFYAENGASVIIGHHPHCISGFEVYKNTPIFYSLGNFLFTWKSIRESWYKGLVLQLSLGKKSGIRWRLVPVVQALDTHKLTFPDDSKRQVILSEVNDYSRIIADEKLLSEQWEGFVADSYNEKIDLFNPLQVFRNRRILNLFRKTGISKMFRNREYYARILNNIRCESHHDLLKEAVKRYIEK